MGASIVTGVDAAPVLDAIEHVPDPVATVQRMASCGIGIFPPLHDGMQAVLSRARAHAGTSRRRSRDERTRPERA